MKYYLIIGYQLVEKHKEFPTVRVYINEQLIDEFECDNEQATEISIQERAEVKAYGKCHTMGRDTIDTFKYSTPAKYKVIELDSSTWLDDGELMIEVSNNNSNYNNGFMTKESQVWFTPVFLIRKDMYDDKSILYSIIEKLSYARQKQRRDNGSRAKWDSKVRPRWPGFNSYPGWNYSKTVELHRGGNFEIKFNIKKKHKIHMLVGDNLPIKGYFHLDRFFLAWYQHHSKNYFELVEEEILELDTGAGKTNTYLKEKSKQINTRDED